MGGFLLVFFSFFVFFSSISSENPREFLKLVENGDVEAVAAFLDKLSDATQVVNSYLPSSKQTALHIALSNGFEDIVDTLLATTTKWEIDVNAQDEHGKTPLHLACEFAYPEAVENLLLLKADFKLATKDAGWKAIHLAASGDTEEHLSSVMKLFLEVDPENTIIDFEDPQLKDSLRSPEHLTQLEMTTADTKDTPLTLAAQHDHVEVLNLLLALGANIHHQNDKGNTALHLAVLRGTDFHVSMELLHHQANVNITNGEGKTPLDLATSEEIQQLLTEYSHGSPEEQEDMDDGNEPEEEKEEEESMLHEEL